MVDRQRDVLRLKVELVGILPPIWREILIPARYTFWDLHVAIQDAMGWLDSHLHEFRLGDPERGKTLGIGIPTGEGGPSDALPGWEISVIEHVSVPGQRIEYEYDFGDGWVHQITLLGLEPRLKGQRYPRCVAGERACPPEDCGGVPGYQSLVDALLDPKHPEHAVMSEWIPRGWGPELFKPQNVRFDNSVRRWKLAFSPEED